MEKINQNYAKVMQNLELSNKSRNTKTAKEHIERVFQQLVPDYQQTQPERHQLAFWEDSQEFTILGVIEMFTTDIRGYASQILSNNNLANANEIVANLDQLKIFDIPYFSEWYFSHISDYPQLKCYIQTLNYLRLLIIEYIKNYAS